MTSFENEQRKNAILLAYGILWHASDFHPIPPSEFARLARLALREALTLEERGAGIELARNTVPRIGENAGRAPTTGEAMFFSNPAGPGHDHIKKAFEEWGRPKFEYPAEDAELNELRRDILEMTFRYFGVPEKPRLRIADEPFDYKLEDLQTLQKKLAEHFGENAKRTFAFYWAELNPQAPAGYKFSYNGYNMSDVPDWVAQGLQEMGTAMPGWKPIPDVRSPEQIQRERRNREREEARAKVEDAYKKGATIEYTPLDDPLYGWFPANDFIERHSGRFFWDDNDYRVKVQK